MPGRDSIRRFEALSRYELAGRYNIGADGIGLAYYREEVVQAGFMRMIGIEQSEIVLSSLSKDYNACIPCSSMIRSVVFCFEYKHYEQRSLYQAR
jgi:hypothetical protein